MTNGRVAFPRPTRLTILPLGQQQQGRRPSASTVNSSVCGQHIPLQRSQASPASATHVDHPRTSKMAGRYQDPSRPSRHHTAQGAPGGDHLREPGRGDEHLADQRPRTPSAATPVSPCNHPRASARTGSTSVTMTCAPEPPGPRWGDSPAATTSLTRPPTTVPAAHMMLVGPDDPVEWWDWSGAVSAVPA